MSCNISLHSRNGIYVFYGLKNEPKYVRFNEFILLWHLGTNKKHFMKICYVSDTMLNISVCHLIISSPSYCNMGLPGGSVDKESACNAVDLGSVSGLGRSPGGQSNPFQYSCLENPHGLRSLAGYKSMKLQRAARDRVTKHSTL